MIKISTPRNARHIKQKDIFCPSIMQGRRLCLKSSYLEANQGDLFFFFFSYNVCLKSPFLWLAIGWQLSLYSGWFPSITMVIDVVSTSPYFKEGLEWRRMRVEELYQQGDIWGRGSPKIPTMAFYLSTLRLQ